MTPTKTRNNVNAFHIPLEHKDMQNWRQKIMKIVENYQDIKKESNALVLPAFLLFVSNQG